MFNIIFYFKYILRYLTTIFDFFAIITTIFSRIIFALITLHFFTFEKLIFPSFFPIKYTMSHSTNSNGNFCDVCDLSFETKKGLYKHQSYDSKHKELLEKMFGSDVEAAFDVKPKAERVLPPSPQPIPKNMERVYDSEKEDYFLRPKTKGALPMVGLRPAVPRVPQTESKFKTESIPKDNTKDIIKTKPINKLKTKIEDNIYSKIKFRREECNEQLKIK